MECSRCHKEITEDQSYVYQGKVLCEDCMMDIGLSSRQCNPWATYVDMRTRHREGQTGSQGLTDMEKQVYELVRERGRMTREDVMSSLGLSETDLKVQLVPLMHGDLVKEAGEGGQLYLTVPG